MDEITAAFNDFVIGAAPDLSEMYALIYAAIQGESALPDANGNPVMIAPNVSAWFGAAEQANGGTGGASTLIRTYTQAQIEIRSGEAMADVRVAREIRASAGYRRGFFGFNLVGENCTIVN